MADKEVESPGGWDAKINAKPGKKDSAGKAMGYEDAETQKREDQPATGKAKDPASDPAL
ncbi:hypothetical protein GTW51_09965 [Aurantimonas aggregata]|uniref:Uncharacterized protein n=1 Tax=Aurantimonas aggregata TaxID=2047720 RepID=A0A6L9MGW1_9HYPH|nr:hypothetical protein [Aurantimonas aggregata]NDV87027.1 hypothetical protein [Aurantimonas aggregata]